MAFYSLPLPRWPPTMADRSRLAAFPTSIIVRNFVNFHTDLPPGFNLRNRRRPFARAISERAPLTLSYHRSSPLISFRSSPAGSALAEPRSVDRGMGNSRSFFRTSLLSARRAGAIEGYLRWANPLEYFGV